MMRPSRRDLLVTSAATLAASFAGCNTAGDTETDEPTDTTAGASSDEGSEQATVPVNTAVAAEWNAMRARLSDALALGAAGDAETGVAVAQQTFARFEQASGEYGAHEMLETTSEANYEGLEEALGELRTAGLQAGDIDRAREEATIASTQLAEDVSSRFEETAVHDAFESADSEAYESFEDAVGAVTSAAESEDVGAVQTSAAEAFQAALDGSYALADTERAAGAGHMAALQARGWDAAALASMGGPATAFAHAAALTIYVSACTT